MVIGIRKHHSLTLTLCALALSLIPGCRTNQPSAPVTAESVKTPSGGIKTDRIVTIGASISESVCALGSEKQIVGADDTSLFPDSVARLPKVGYQRTLQPEGILSLKPSVVIVSSEAGPAETFEQIRRAGVPVFVISSDYTAEGVKNKIRQIGQILDKKAATEALVSRLDQEFSAISSLASQATSHPKVLFFYSRGQGAQMIAGTETPADAMIRLAGAENAVKTFTGYKPMTPEATVAANPDVILVPAKTLELMGGVEALIQLPGIEQTEAGKHRRVVAVDDAELLGFGPRTAGALNRLVKEFHPDPGKQP